MQFETEQLPAFLAHIARDEARELERLRRDYEAEARAIRDEARRSSRMFHRRVAEETRTRIESDHNRKLSRARNEFRRRRWQALEELRGRARGKIRAELCKRWDDSKRQMSWCRYWIEACDALDGKGDLEVVTSGDIDAKNRDEIERLVGARGGRLIVDESMEPGILVRYGARTIDGLLSSQVEPLLESVGRELSGWLHREDDSSEVDL